MACCPKRSLFRWLLFLGVSSIHCILDLITGRFINTLYPPPPHSRPQQSTARTTGQTCCPSLPDTSYFWWFLFNPLSTCSLNHSVCPDARMFQEEGFVLHCGVHITSDPMRTSESMSLTLWTQSWAQRVCGDFAKHSYIKAIRSIILRQPGNIEHQRQSNC